MKCENEDVIIGYAYELDDSISMAVAIANHANPLTAALIAASPFIFSYLCTHIITDAILVPIY